MTSSKQKGKALTDVPQDNIYQLLPPLADSEYQDLKADIARRGVLVAVEMDDKGRVLDGHHRLQVCAELGIKDYPSIIRIGLSEAEKRTHVRALNLHRRHLSSAQRRVLIEQQLKDTPRRSNLSIAKLLGVNDKTVATVRDRLERRSEIPNVTIRLDAKGRAQPARRASIIAPDRSQSRRAFNALSQTPSIGWESAWGGGTGLYLVLHNERESKQSNETEARIIEELLQAGGAQPDNSIAIVTPHRAQRTLLKTRLERFGSCVDLIDTVERLQGGERPTVIVSATASDPSAISSSAKFILDLNRSNVAFSRTQRRLIVVVSEALLNHIPVEYENYESTMLWKSLRSVCSHLVATERVGNHVARVLTVPAQLVA